MSGSRFSQVSQGAHFSTGSGNEETIFSQCGTLKRLAGGLLELLIRGVTVTVGTVVLLSGL